MKIHRQIFKTYGENTMNDGIMQKCVRKFNEGYMNVNFEWVVFCYKDFVKESGWENYPGLTVYDFLNFLMSFFKF